jgi:hypothetical protein
VPAPDPPNAEAPELLLGPLLRWVGTSGATVWVETDRPCEVTVNGHSERTWTIDGNYFALVHVSGLTAGETTPYTIELDGHEVWPEPGSELPPSVIRPLHEGEQLELVFGSCRVSQPHEPPWVLPAGEHPLGQGIDALRALALELARRDRAARLPDCLLMLGDQVYADDLSPQLREVTESRPAYEEAPNDQLCDFDEYALAYREAWSEPLIRWLLSTVPTAMIFDDHEIHAQWKLSVAWQREHQGREMYDRHITGGLMAYWVYQHLGNLPADEIAEHELLERIRAADDGGPILRAEMADADRQTWVSRWSYCRDLGDARLIVIDSRAGRKLDRPDRQMVSEAEWEWILEKAQGEFSHLLLASSVPFFLTPGLHFGEAFDAALAEGSRRPRVRAIGEKLRQKLVMDHWASFPASFDELCRMLGEVASGRCGPGKAPRSIVMLSGDVHHCYLAEVELPEEPDAESVIWQAVCSAYRKDLEPREKAVMRFGNSRRGERLARWLAGRAGVEEPAARWRITSEPCYDNQVGMLWAGPERAEVRVRTPDGSDWRDPELRTVFAHDLLRGEPLTE